MSVKLGGPSLHDLASIYERIYPGWRVAGGDFVNTSDLSRKERKVANALAPGKAHYD